LDESLFDTFTDYPHPYEQMGRKYSVILNDLTSEPHTLRIDVRARAFYKMTKATESPLNASQTLPPRYTSQKSMEDKMILFSIDEAATIPEFPALMILPVFITATLLIVACKHKLPKKRQARQAYLEPNKVTLLKTVFFLENDSN